MRGQGGKSSATDPSIPRLLLLMSSFFSDVLLQSALNRCIHPSLVMLFLLKIFALMFSSAREALCTRPAAIWVTTVASSLLSLRFSTLSVLFMFRILPIAQPTQLHNLEELDLSWEMLFFSWRHCVPCSHFHLVFWWACCYVAVVTRFFDGFIAVGGCKINKHNCKNTAKCTTV